MGDVKPTDAPSTSAAKKPLSPAAGVRPPQRWARPRPLRGLGGQGHRHRLL